MEARGRETVEGIEPAGGARIKRLAALLFLAAAGLPTLLYPLGVDQGMFSYIGRIVAEGGVPYRDGWDVKPPAIFFIYALGWLATPEPAISARVLDVATTVWAGWLLMRLCDRLHKPEAGPYAAFLFGASYYYQFNFWHTAQAEGFAAPFTVLGLIWALDARSFPEPNRKLRFALLSGVCFGFVACLKTSLVLYAIIPAVILARRPWKTSAKSLGALLAGGLVVPALFLSFFAAHGAVGHLRTAFEAQAAYAQSSSGLDWRRFELIVFGLRGFYPYLFWGFPAAVLFLLAAARVAEYRFIWAWIGAFWIQVLLQNKYLEYHFVPLILPVALALGLAVAHGREVLGRIRGVPARTAAQGGLTLAILLLVIVEIKHFVVPIKYLSGALGQDWWDHQFTYNYYNYGWSRRAAQAVRSLTQPGDTILVYGFDPTIYLMSDRRSASRHLSSAPIRLVGWFPEPMREQFFRELEADVSASRPKALVTDMNWEWGMETAGLSKGKLQFCGLPYRLAGVSGHWMIFRLEQDRP